MQLIEFIAGVQVISFLIYIPYICWLDWKYREVKHNVWIPLVIFNIPATISLYGIGALPLELFALSLVVVWAYFAGMKLNFYQGADFMFLMWISLFFVINPLSGRVLMPAVVLEFLLAIVIAMNIVMLAIKRSEDYKNEPLKFPMMFIISAAFILAVVLG